MLRNFFWFFFISSFILNCSKNNDSTSIKHFSIVGNYSGTWQECTIQNMKIECLPIKNGNTRIIILDQNSIIFQAEDMIIKDTLLLKPNSSSTQNSSFTFEKSAGNTKSQIIFNSRDNSIEYCNQILNDSFTIENCFEGFKN